MLLFTETQLNDNIPGATGVFERTEHSSPEARLTAARSLFTSVMRGFRTL